MVIIKDSLTVCSLDFLYLDASIKCLITKAAALVLLWTLCFSTALWSDALLIFHLHTEELLPSLILLPTLLSLDGWLTVGRFQRNA